MSYSKILDHSEGRGWTCCGNAFEKIEIKVSSNSYVGHHKGEAAVLTDNTC